MLHFSDVRFYFYYVLVYYVLFKSLFIYISVQLFTYITF